MFSLVLVLGVINCLVFANENNPNHSIALKPNHGMNNIIKNNVASHHNVSYIDKSENMLRTPNVNKLYTDHKKKKPKKSPKTTIQKIIKKNRAKVLKKIYVNRITSKPTPPPRKVDYSKVKGQNEKLQKKVTTTPLIHRKRSRKFSPKEAGYHAQFKKLHYRKEKRNKRELSRELYILKDLDEIEFLSKEDGGDVVKAHVKRVHW